MYLGAQSGKALAHYDPNNICLEIVSKHFVVSKDFVLYEYLVVSKHLAVSKHCVVSKHLAVTKHCLVSKTSGGWCEARYTTPTVAHQQEESF